MVCLRLKFVLNDRLKSLFELWWITARHAGRCDGLFFILHIYIQLKKSICEPPNTPYCWTHPGVSLSRGTQASKSLNISGKFILNYLIFEAVLVVGSEFSNLKSKILIFSFNDELCGKRRWLGRPRHRATACRRCRCTDGTSSESYLNSDFATRFFFHLADDAFFFSFAYSFRCLWTWHLRNCKQFWINC